MTHASALLVENFTLIENLSTENGVLDLACGSGRNGLYVARRNIPVTFLDHNKESLDILSRALESEAIMGDCLHRDLEKTNSEPLANLRFDACLVFNYLHRPLMPAIKECVVSGGLVYYETFTIANRRFGRPRNPDFLLKENELLEQFTDWKIIHYFEGDKTQPDRAVAQIIARKP